MLTVFSPWGDGVAPLPFRVVPVQVLEVERVRVHILGGLRKLSLAVLHLKREL